MSYLDQMFINTSFAMNCAYRWNKLCKICYFMYLHIKWYILILVSKRFKKLKQPEVLNVILTELLLVDNNKKVMLCL